MSIFIRECGHSGETNSRNPKICRSCVWIARNGPPKRLYNPKATAWVRPNFKRNTSGLVAYRLRKLGA